MNQHFTLVAAFLVAAVSAPAQELRSPRPVRVVASASRPFDDNRIDRRIHNGGERRIHNGGERGRDEIGSYRCGPQARFSSPVPAPRGHWETIHESVLVEAGYWQEEHVPPVYGFVYDRCGHRTWGIIEAGYCRSVWCPPRYETRCRKVWVVC